ncbi:MAG: OmpA family protein [Bacteroidia bacterium]|nr:OmpA family protein [Bacteroidia bacterium]
MKNTFFFLIIMRIVILHCQEKKYEVINLGPNVNSKYEELMPYITPDGSKLFFIRGDHPENNKYPNSSQDIWFCKKQPDGSWGPAKRLGYPFNTDHHNALIGQSSDGTIRYIKDYYKNGEFKKDGFSVSKLEKEGWSVPEGIDIPGFDRMIKGDYLSCNISSSNNIFLISFSEQKESNKNYDIYVCFLRNNKWTKPEKIGIGKISTPYHEMSPFLASDNITLYFSSDRPGGYGSNDIWMTKRLDDTWQNWSEPVNLGPDINNSGWDAFFTIPASGDYFYMVRDGDIVKIKPREEQKPNPVVIVKGTVLNSKTNEPLEAGIQYIDLSDGREAGIARSNPNTGEYLIILPYGKNYSFKANKQGFYAISDNMDLTNISTYKEITRNLFLTPIEQGQVVRINNIFFEFGKSTLKPESYYELDNIVKLLTENPTMEIFIAGHTDNVGSDEFNLKLSKERAGAVVDYLVSKGIASSRLTSDGFGKNKPVADNNTDEGRAINRRVEFTILKK